MIEHGLFNNESSSWSAEDSVEAGFYSVEEAEAAIRERYSPDDELVIHAIEDEEDEEDEEDDE